MRAPPTDATVAAPRQFDEDTCAQAAAGGNLGVLKWLRETAKCPWDRRTLDAAAGRGDLKAGVSFSGI